METSENINELASALSKAQGKITGALKDSSNPFFKSKYADLAACWDACRGPLSENGLAVIQTTEPGDGVTLVTTLAHSSGQWISSKLIMAPKDFSPQSVGSCITYARRYALAAMVGLAQIDDDANSAQGISPNTAVQSGKPASLEAQLVASNFQAALKMANVEKIREIHEDTNAKGHELYEDAWRLLDSKTRAAIKAALNGQKTSAN